MIFKPKKVPLLTSYEANQILKTIEEAPTKLSISLNLGLSQSEVYLEREKVVLPSRQTIDISSLKKMAKETRTIFFLEDNQIFKAAVAREHFYKLVPTQIGHPPTLEIDGIHMHRVKDILPDRDAQMKIDTINPRPGSIGLDIGTGLGYTAAHAIKSGAAKVITIEKDLNILEIAQLNPWSYDLASEKIKIIVCDATVEVGKFDDDFFDFIIHDPPRFALAGELYSEEFYQKLHRVLKANCKLFHYVGSPGAKYRRKDIVAGVMKRLKAVGFKVERKPRVLGVLATK
ncbi:MAG: MnmC family methyltransferase [Euryarchaeota archaeon]|nr:MnmC family methyltransferase [Euryarchaeota archaeon]